LKEAQPFSPPLQKDTSCDSESSLPNLWWGEGITVIEPAPSIGLCPIERQTRAPLAAPAPAKSDSLSSFF
jgi:hypothetical protein